MKHITSFFELITRLIATLLLIAFSGMVTANLIGAEPTKGASVALMLYAAYVATILAICAVKPSARVNFNARSGLAYTTYTVDLFITRLIEKLWPNNSFLMKSVDHTSEVTGGSTVHIPKFTNSASSVKNPSVFPLSVEHREATDLSYTLHYSATKPEVITVKDFNELNYDHLDAVLKNHRNTQEKASAEIVINEWLDGAYAAPVRTTGASRAASAAGATGNRKKLTLADLRSVQEIMDNADIPEEGRYALLTPRMILDLQEDSAVAAPDYNRLVNMETGQLPFLAGFTIMKRSKVGVYDNTGTPVQKDYTESSFATATSDNSAGICWQQDQVARALGQVEVFAVANDPLFQADIASTSVRCGGITLRAEGVVPIVETVV